MRFSALILVRTATVLPKYCTSKYLTIPFIDQSTESIAMVEGGAFVKLPQENTKSSRGNQRTCSPRSVVLWSVAVLFAAITSRALVSPSESSAGSGSGSSWWDGMQFEDFSIEKSIHSEFDSRYPTGGPVIQIPCGLIVEGCHRNDGSCSSDTLTDEREVLPLSTIVDTSLSTSTIKQSVLQKYPQLQPLVVRRHGGKDEGTQFYIPHGRLQLRMGSEEATTLVPPLMIDRQNEDAQTSQTENTFELRLGLDFLWQYKATLDLSGSESMKLIIPSSTDMKTPTDNKGVSVVYVPFIRPRITLNPGDDSVNEL